MGTSLWDASGSRLMGKTVQAGNPPLGSAGGQSGNFWLGLENWKVDTIGWQGRCAAGSHVPLEGAKILPPLGPPAPSTDKTEHRAIWQGRNIPVSHVNSGQGALGAE